MGNINFDGPFYDRIRVKKSKEPKDTAVYDTIFCISLTFGLTLLEVSRITWSDIIVLDDENEFASAEELNIRNYYVPIHKKIGELFVAKYITADYPKREDFLFESIRNVSVKKIGESNVLESIEQKLITYYFQDMEGTIINYDNYIKKIFGRNVFKTNGYTNEVSKRLKLHFKLNTNQELFALLGYNSKDEIHYNLSEVKLSLISKEQNQFVLNSKIKYHIDKKNFNLNISRQSNQFYPFQKFNSFVKFLLNAETTSIQKEIINRRTNRVDTDIICINKVTESVRLLLLLSTYHGIRPSRLLQLEWKDLLSLKGHNLKWKATMKKEVEFDNHKYMQEKHISRLLEFFFYSQRIRDKEYNYLETIDAIDLSKPVFTMNNGNPITQPSLLREIKNGLAAMHFPHAHKFTTKSPLIMFGRRVIEIRGDHKPTIKRLIDHFNFKSKKKLFEFLHIEYSVNKRGIEDYPFKRNRPLNIFEENLYAL